MVRNPQNQKYSSDKFMTQLAAEKKKVVMALGLIAVMTFMWVRVLGKKGPDSAKAVSVLKQTQEQNNSQLKISFIDLPYVKGRNDELTRDFFVAGRDGIRRPGGIISDDAQEDYLKKITRIMKLEAIDLGENPQAFINGKLLSVGEKLSIDDGVSVCEFEIVGIEENTVLAKNDETEITLKLTDGIEITD